MAFCFTFAIECYREEDAERLGETLRSLVIDVAGREVPMAYVSVSARAGFGYVFAGPRGPGYSPYGYGEGLNEPSAIRIIVDRLCEMISGEPGVRRALCGYEAQDIFEDNFGNPELYDCHWTDLVYNKKLGPPHPGAHEYGIHHYRNPPQ